jgi:hypothetical protein
MRSTRQQVHSRSHRKAILPALTTEYGATVNRQVMAMDKRGAICFPPHCDAMVNAPAYQATVLTSRHSPSGHHQRAGTTDRSYTFSHANCWLAGVPLYRRAQSRHGAS